MLARFFGSRVPSREELRSRFARDERTHYEVPTEKARLGVVVEEGEEYDGKKVASQTRFGAVLDVEEPPFDDAEKAEKPYDETLVAEIFVGSIKYVIVVYVTCFIMNCIFFGSFTQGIFVTKSLNGTGSNTTAPTLVVEVTQTFVDAVNLGLFPFVVMPIVPLTNYVAKQYKEDTDLYGIAQDLTGWPCWAITVWFLVFFCWPGSAFLVIFMNWQPDFVSLFHIPDTWFFPGNEEAATALGLVLASMVYWPLAVYCVYCCVRDIVNGEFCT